jgi:hypothetical protein
MLKNYTTGRQAVTDRIAYPQEQSKGMKTLRMKNVD